VNLILFEPAETARPLARRDPRAAHVLDVLRRKEGETFDAGLIDGPRGKGKLLAIGPDALTLEFTWGALPDPLDSIAVIVGLPRPQTARKILQEASSLGVAQLHFVATDKGEPSYAQSTLWTSAEWRRHLVAGAEQAFDTRLPEVTHGAPLETVLAALELGGARVALDNYESPQAFSALALTPPVTLALGSERGWSARERDLLRAHAFAFAHLGARVLRTETAAVAALALIKAKLGRF
jgi:16S rRNA (uracil1498-N3)-methyltransferase